MLVYRIHNTVNGKNYVGQTRFSLEFRWKGHLSDARRGSKMPIHRAIRKYGTAAFELSVLQELPDREELDLAEVSMIAFHQALVPYGYNLTTGGTGGYTMSEETKTRIGLALRDRKFRPETVLRFKDAHKRQWEGVRARGGITSQEKANRSAGQKSRRPYFERVRIRREALTT